MSGATAIPLRRSGAPTPGTVRCWSASDGEDDRVHRDRFLQPAPLVPDDRPRHLVVPEHFLDRVVRVLHPHAGRQQAVHHRLWACHLYIRWHRVTSAAIPPGRGPSPPRCSPATMSTRLPRRGSKRGEVVDPVPLELDEVGDVQLPGTKAPHPTARMTVWVWCSPRGWSLDDRSSRIRSPVTRSLSTTVGVYCIACPVSSGRARRHDLAVPGDVEDLLLRVHGDQATPTWGYARSAWSCTPAARSSRRRRGDRTGADDRDVVEIALADHGWPLLYTVFRREARRRQGGCFRPCLVYSKCSPTRDPGSGRWN